MADLAPGGANDFNTKILEEFRANEGRVQLLSSVKGQCVGMRLVRGPPVAALIDQEMCG